MTTDKVFIKDDLQLLSGIIDPEVQEYEFEFSCTVEGEKRKGVFKVKYPSIMDRIKIGVLKSKYLEGLEESKVDVSTSNMVFMLSLVDTLLVKQPSWFNVSKMTELEELIQLYEVVNNWIARFRGEFFYQSDKGHSETSTIEKDMEGSTEIKDATNGQENT